VSEEPSEPVQDSADGQEKAAAPTPAAPSTEAVVAESTTEAVAVFAVGDSVEFEKKSVTLRGEVLRVNKKTITVAAEDGANHRVPPESLRAVRAD
jgi:hypothetical protein